MSIFRTIGNYFSSHQRQILSVLFVLGMFFLACDSTFADTTQSPQAGESSAGMDWINFFFKMFAVMLAVMTQLVGLFLYPEWTSGSAIGLDKALHELWILVSNMVYFVFAFIFVWIAFMNIIGKDGETTQLKNAIPRFIIGVLIVPFSWFFVQFLISVSSVLTAAVLSLPLETLKTYMEENPDGYKIPYCEAGYTIDTTQGGTADPNNVVKCKDGADPVDTPIDEMMMGDNDDGQGVYSIMYVYTYGVMRFDDAQKLFRTDVSSVTALIDLIFKSGFSLIFIFVYALLVIALGLALFVRGVYLWIFSMFSPVFGLLFFFKKSGGDGVLKLFTLKEFIALAMVPVYVSAALVFGLLFLAVAGKGLSQEDKTTNMNRAKITQEGDNKSCLEFNDYQVCWAGVFNAENSEQTIFGGFKGSIGALIASTFGIVFLWMAVMSALKQSEITREVVSPISQFGESIGKLIRESPKYAPIIPTPGGPLSATGLGSAGQSFSQIVSSKFTTKGSEFGTRAADIVVGKSKVSEMRLLNDSNKLNQTVDNFNSHVGKMQKHISDLNETLRNDQEREQFMEMIKTHFGDKVYDDVKNQKNHIDFFDKLKKSANDNFANMPTSGKLFYTSKLKDMGDPSALKAFFESVLPPQTPPQAGAQGVAGASTPLSNHSHIQVMNNNSMIQIAQRDNGTNPESIFINQDNTGARTVDVGKLTQALKTRNYENNITEADLRTTLENVGVQDTDTVINAMKTGNSPFGFQTPPNPPTP